jgi:hypothetical protein
MILIGGCLPLVVQAALHFTARLAQLCAKFHTLGKSLLCCSNAVNSIDATRLLKACVFGEHCSLIYSQARRAVWL